MIIPKLVSSKVCVEQMYSVTGIQEELIEDDIRLWVLQIVDLIQYPLQYIPKVHGSKMDPDYAFTNYKVPLPCDFYKLIPSGISVNGNPVRWRTNSFHYLMSGDCCNLENLNSGMDIFTDQFGNEFSPQASSNEKVPNVFQDITFDITDNQIVFNIKEGTVCLAYLAYPFDNDGFLMIPDTAKYVRAVTNYLIWRYDYIKWRQGYISDKVYKVSEEEKDWAISSCSAELKQPDVEQMDALKNTLIRLIPRFNDYNHHFGTQGIMESRRFK